MYVPWLHQEISLIDSNKLATKFNLKKYWKIETAAKVQHTKFIQQLRRVITETCTINEMDD